MKVKIPLYDKLHAQICSFNENKKIEYPLFDSLNRGIFMFIVELNGGSGHVFDIVYVDGNKITKTIKNGDTSMSYSISNNHLIVESYVSWSYGIVISNFL